jgi:hypothetical protein
MTRSLPLVLCLGVVASLVPADPTAPDELRDRIKPGFAFLARRMDQFQSDFIIYDDMDSGGIQFYPSGWMGDLIGLPPNKAAAIIDDECAAVQPHQGTSCIQLTYPEELATKGTLGWAAIYWIYPDNNFGKVPGYDLSKYKDGATLVFAARGEKGGEVAEFKIGGVNRPPDRDPKLPHSDSFGPLSTGPLTLGKNWQEYRIPLKEDLGNLIGGFCWVTKRQQNPKGCRIYLDSIRIELGEKGRKLRLNEPHFIPSYVSFGVGKPDRYFRNVCYCYDQALALLAFLARGEADDLRRAKLLADMLVYAQEHDRYFKDGRLRTAYSCGDPLYYADGKPAPSVRLPGWWDRDNRKWAEDEYCVSTDCGNLAWCAIALLSYWEKVDPKTGEPYLKSATRLAEWIHQHCYRDDAMGGYSGGLTGWETPNAPQDGQQSEKWRSTEHNIDLYVAFTRLAKATRDKVWNERAAHARKFVDDQMWNPKGGHFWTGTTPNNPPTINESPIPLDIHPWALLAFRDVKRYRPGVEWALKNCWVAKCPVDGRSRGFDFDTDLDGVWWEGTGQMQLALRALGEPRATDVLAALRDHASDPKRPGAILAASRDNLTTGFTKASGPWVYYRRPHVGATCWYLFAEMGWNPYWAEPI